MIVLRSQGRPELARSLTFIAALLVAVATITCEDLEVADQNSGFRTAPTVERAPTAKSAPTVAAAPTVAKFEGFEQAPTAEKFGGFEQAPTVTQAEGFKQAPTVTQFEGFNDADDPCSTFLDEPTPANAQLAAEWAEEQLGGNIDPDDVEGLNGGLSGRAEPVVVNHIRRVGALICSC